MFKNLTSTQLLLIGIATVLLFLAAFSFFLIQNPSGQLPFAPPRATSSQTPPPPFTETISLAALTPTRHTSYTPFAGSKVSTPSPETLIPFASETVRPNPSQPTTHATTQPAGIQTGTPSPTSNQSPTSASSVSPTSTATLASGEYRVTGRVIQNGTPVANALVDFADDVAPRQASTDSGGHYSFITLAPGASFTLIFQLSDNPNLTPSSNITSFTRLSGNLPGNANPIDLPDLEISVNLSGMIFELLTPSDGAAYSASAISPSNQLQFTWSLYSQGGTYSVEIGPIGSDQPILTTSQLASSSYMWNGTLNDGSHISAGTYWWRVAVTKPTSNYVQVIYTQPFDLQFSP